MDPSLAASLPGTPGRRARRRGLQGGPAAHRFGEVESLNRLADASIIPPSIRTASREMGVQLMSLGATWAWCAEAVASMHGASSDRDQIGPWHHPVAFGTLGAFAGAAVVDVLTAYLHQAALGMIGAGVRAIPVGHTHGQQVLAYLHDEILDLAAGAGRSRPSKPPGRAAPLYEILCDEQTQLYARMFRS